MLFYLPFILDIFRSSQFYYFIKIEFVDLLKLKNYIYERKENLFSSIRIACSSINHFMFYLRWTISQY